MQRSVLSILVCFGWIALFGAMTCVAADTTKLRPHDTMRLPAVSLNASDMDGVANTYPHVGAVVIFHYKSGLHHVAVISDISPDGDLVIKEANYHHCTVDQRTIRADDPSIIGYWSAGNTP
jgi:hypothetical protein